MTCPPSNRPPPKLPKHVETSGNVKIAARGTFGLSKAQTKELQRAMRAMIWKVGCPVHLHGDVVHDAFVSALCKPISQRPAVTDWNRFVAWMCTLAKLSALTNRNKEQRRRLNDDVSEADIAAFLSAPAHAPDVGLRKALQQALTSLEPEDQDLLVARFVEDKSIQDIADEKGLPWSTAKSRLERVLHLLRAALPGIIVVALLSVAKNARAQGARLARHVSRLIPHAAQAAGAATVTVACGIIVPASSLATVNPHEATTATHASSIAPALVEAVEVPRDAPFSVEVARVKRIALDQPVGQCSPAAMMSSKITTYIQATVLPFVLVVAPAMTSVACVGAEQQRLPQHQPQEADDENPNNEGQDPYDGVCEDQRARGSSCPTKEEWCAKMGKRPAAWGCK